MWMRWRPSRFLEVFVRRTIPTSRVLPAITLGMLGMLPAFGARAAAQAQQQASAGNPHGQMGHSDLETFVRAAVAIGAARDSMQAQISSPKNAKLSAQQDIRVKFQAQVADILHRAGLTQGEFDRKTFQVSADSATRRVYDSLIVAVTGAPIPSVYVPPNAGPQVKVPATAAGNHIGHVVNSYSDTPDSKGLLPVALGDARVAIQHAQLAARAPT